jgi:hypothetical protein
VPHEVVEECELSGSKLDLASIQVGAVAPGIERERADSKNSSHPTVNAPPERTDSRKELSHREGLYEIVIRS